MYYFTFFCHTHVHSTPVCAGPGSPKANSLVEIILDTVAHGIRHTSTVPIRSKVTGFVCANGYIYHHAVYEALPMWNSKH